MKILFYLIYFFLIISNLIEFSLYHFFFNLFQPRFDQIYYAFCIFSSDVS